VTIPERALPIPSEHREFLVKVEGQAVSRTHQLIAATVVHSVNRISSARLVYLDGDAASGDFPLSSSGTFAPGRAIEILAGPADRPISIFKGVVIAESVKVRRSGAPELVVECRHQAVKLTVGRKSACFFAQTDADIASSILDAAGVAAEVESTAVVHPQQVQIRATDWDFLLARAEANGRLVFTEGDKVIIKAPAMGSPAVTLLFGATLLELDAEIDARSQWSAVKGVTWDPAEQAVLEREANDPGVSGPGDLASDDLARVIGLPVRALGHAALTADEAQAWADAEWLKSRLSKVSGRAKCEGMATVKPGDVVRLSGVGARYSGDVFVTGVRHDSDPAMGWKTHLQFGSLARRAAEERPISAPAAGALLPAASGLSIGVVTGNEDPDGEHRVRVRLPMVDAEGDGVWARVASPDAGEERGFFFRPEIGDEVVVGFLESDPRCAVILGMLHSSAKAAPLPGSDDNHQKVYQSRARMRLFFDDQKKLVQLETEAGNRIALSEEDKSITIEDQNGNSITLDADGIHVKSTKALDLEAGTDVKVKGTSSAAIESSATASLKASQIKLSQG
jgi:Rhs element Vgr protein